MASFEEDVKSSVPLIVPVLIACKRTSFLYRKEKQICWMSVLSLIFSDMPRDVTNNGITSAIPPDNERLKLTDFTPDTSYDTHGNPEGKELIQVNDIFLTEEEHEYWRKAIIYVSIATISILSLFAIAFLLISFYTDSAAALSLSFDMILDVLSSGVILWRFSGKSVTLGSSDKENKTIIVLGCMFIAFSAIIICKGVVTLICQDKVTSLILLTTLSTAGAIVTTILTIIKLTIARRLHSKSMYCDAFSSAMGAITGYSMLASTIAYALVGIWFLDAFIAILVGITMALWGIMLLVRHISCKKTPKPEKNGLV
ncbi:transmembrane protein 163a-like [Saccoglossus kowalevskii]|uniref:Transmembrane protein 163-like n=1 Tax=Saccoglossus kowalevskii TaxID=10224 RepID=A0ABM0MT96_SACKO|nr:PREDICTED: transmembrane protein 163-like [Saccoglossus kowalevskii]